MTVAPTGTPSQEPIAKAARIWAENGFSVVPIRADGTKRPAYEWRVAQSQALAPDRVHAWFSAQYGHGHGIGIVCGKVSGNLEMTELEGRATSEESTGAIFDAAEQLPGALDVLNLLFEQGYCEITPSGGLHLMYRIADHEVPGNTKIARRPATAEELAEKPDDKIKVLAETRGEGGYVIVAPTSGTVHPTGLPWEVQAGQIGQVPTITWEQRNLLHEAIRTVLDQMPEPQAPSYPPVPLRHAPNGSARANRPGDDFNERAEWIDIIGPVGWQIHSRKGATEIWWTRPGKSKRDGHSATTGHAGTGANDRLYVMSSASEFNTDEPLSKFYVYSHYYHRGDFREATKALAALGYGEQLPQHPAWEDWSSGLPASNVDSPTRTPAPKMPRRDRGREDYTISGFANRFAKEQGEYFWYVAEERAWRAWNGTHWQRDEANAILSGSVLAITEDMMDEADRLDAQAAEDPSKLPIAKALRKHVQSIRNGNRANLFAAIAALRLTSASSFDAQPRYMNLRNGVYDLTDDVFLPHDPKYMLTKVAGVDYDPDAKAPRAEAFFSELLPSEPMREFVLQGLGYTLTGEADRKAMFILQGPSNSGKTQLNELAQGIFGDYAVPVSPGAFVKKQEQSPNPELHDARGARFVYTSETSYDIQLDEDLIKRLTGKDSIKTRTLYEKLQQWIPQCVVWLATNNLPRFGSDSEAMWRRVKTVRFVNEFTDDGSSGHQAQPNIGRTLAHDEGAGIFNLLLAALRRYRAAGRLAEPPELKESVAAHRRETDPVTQWVTTVQERGDLVAKPGGRANFTMLRRAYAAWCADEGFSPLAAQRFGIALGQNLSCTRQRSNGETWITGWQWTGAAWLVGQSSDWRNQRELE